MSVVPLLLGGSDSLSVSYGMEPEQEALSIVSFKDREAASQLINEIPIDLFFSMPYLPISFLQSFYQKCQVSQYCLGCNREYYE